MDVAGIAAVLAFYAGILVSGILATRWYKKYRLDGATDSREVSLVAGRKLGGCIGVFTMTATTVGGGYINGTAEYMATMGLAWTLAPFGICAGLTIGGVFFAGRMREQRYLTMFDPFQQKFGHTIVALLYLAAICGDVFWSASVLAALGTSLSVIISLEKTVAMVASAAVTMVYVMFGQVISVAYTDVIQLVFIIFGLVLALPFILTNPAVEPLLNHKHVWIGTIPRSQGAVWADLLVAMTFGTIPWQSYFQRVLSVKTIPYAQVLSVAGGFGAFILAIPPALIGVVAISTDWNQTTRGVSPLATDEAALVLPLALKYLTPRVVSLIGLGAIAAAVMSSVDSAILSSASVFTHNIYKMTLRTKATEMELLWIQRLAVLVVGAIATVMAVFVPSIYGMFILAADIVYVIMFPQLVAVVFIKLSNSYGSLLGYIIGLFLRVSAGEPFLSLPALIRYPGFDYVTEEQLFPFRTFAMLSSLLSIVVISHISKYLFTHFEIPGKYDFFGCFQEKVEEVVTALDHTSRDRLLLSASSEHLNARLEDTDDKILQNHTVGHSAATQNGYCVENYSEKDTETNCGPSNSTTCSVSSRL